MSEHEPQSTFHDPERSEGSEYHVDVASQADLEKLHTAFPVPEDPEQHEFCLELQEKEEGVFLLMRKEAELAGYAAAQFKWQSPYFSHISGPVIMGVMVGKEHRGKRLANKLLSSLESVVRQRGYQEVYLDVAVANQAAIGVYQRNGYHEIPDTTHTLSPEVDPQAEPSVYFKKSLM